MNGNNKIYSISRILEKEAYEEAFQLCQECTFWERRRYHLEILYMQSYALLGLGHVHQAKKWLQKFSKKEKNTPYYLYLEAYLALHRKEAFIALENWTRILEMAPSQTFADRLIKKIQKGEQNIYREVDQNIVVSHYLPLVQTEKSKKKILDFSVKKYALTLSFLFALFILLKFTFFLDFSIPFQSFFADNSLKLPPLPSQGSLISLDKYSEDKPRYIYKERSEFSRDYERALTLVRREKVNQARFLLGKLELSNISFKLKERVLLLRSFIPFIKRKEFKDNVDIEELAQSSYMYRGAQVDWKLKLEAIRPQKKYIQWELSFLEDKLYKVVANYSIEGKDKKEMLSKLSHQEVIKIFGTLNSFLENKFWISIHEVSFP